MDQRERRRRCKGRCKARYLRKKIAPPGIFRTRDYGDTPGCGGHQMLCLGIIEPPQRSIRSTRNPPETPRTETLLAHKNSRELLAARLCGILLVGLICYAVWSPNSGVLR